MESVFQVFLKNNLKTRVYNTTSNTTISEFKKLIEEDILIPPYGYYLIFSAKILNDNLKFKDYNISKESTIHLHFRTCELVNV